MNKLNYVLDCENGTSNVEIIVWISVVMAVATVLFKFRDAVVEFIRDATGQIANFEYK